jgi:glutamate N-acetyltransferase/amino-acid N-acetyltransferase
MADPCFRSFSLPSALRNRLPIDKILAKIPEAFAQLAPDHASWLAAARAICTTDTFPKLLSRTFRLPSAPDRTFRLAGMTKGAGMIHPNMATLLGTICTDAAAEPAALRQALAYAMERSFNSISIDGDTSTNDTVALLANGAAGGPVIRAPSSSSSSTSRVTSSPASAAARADFVAFRAALTAFAAQLAQLVVRDGEGATKFVAVRVARAPSRAVARAVAASVARSPLVKTALYGCDANWGRVLCAVGYTPGLPAGAIRPAETSVSLRVLPPPPPPGSSAVDGASSSPSSSATDGASSSTDGSSADGSAAAAAAAAIDEELRLLVDGEPQRVDEARAREILEHEDLEIVVHLRKEKKKKGDVVGEKERGGATDGDADAEAEADDTEACYWTCDFSHEYITINADYRT